MRRLLRGGLSAAWLVAMLPALVVAWWQEACRYEYLGGRMVRVHRVTGRREVWVFERLDWERL